MAWWRLWTPRDECRFRPPGNRQIAPALTNAYLEDGDITASLAYAARAAGNKIAFAAE